MWFPATVFLVAISSVLAGDVTRRSMVFQDRTDNSYVELVPLKPLNLRAFTLCMRLSTENSYLEVLFAYRTAHFDELNVWKDRHGKVSLYLADDCVTFTLPPFGALETHLCVTWDSSCGAATVYLDGRKSLTKIHKKGHTIHSGGKVIIGQDPDSLLGGFYRWQCFMGTITDINMWDSVLPATAIQDIYSRKTCHALPKGNVFDWETLVYHVHGNVNVITCEL